MKTSKSLKLAVNILRHSKVRSWLTIVGIVIGVAAVVAIISLGNGMQQSLENNLRSISADIITITPGASRATGLFGGMSFDRNFAGERTTTSSTTSIKNLTKKDIQFIKTLDNVDLVYGIVSGRGEVYYLGEKAQISIDGIDPLAWNAITTDELETGRFLTTSDYTSVVIGRRVAEDIFKQPLAINRIITIEDRTFKIVGILKESTANNNMIIMPIEAARSILDNVGENEFQSIIIKVSDDTLMEETVANIDEKLMLFRHVNTNTKDYTITSSQAMSETINETMGSMTLFLTAIAAVSLLVGAIGIANTMFTTVLEKTKEIGIMKAIGAKNSDIMKIFILNSALVGLVGGVIGVILGSVVSSFLNFGAGRVTMSGGVISPDLLALGLLISVGIGVVSGAIPAYRASKLKPVDALRYE